MQRITLSACMLFLVACSDTPKDPGSNLPADSDSACLANELLDGSGICRVVCTGQSDCPDDFACEVAAGLCLPAEVVTCNPADCDEGFVCPPNGDIACVAVDSQDGLCAADGDCPFGYKCENAECVSRAGDIVQTCTLDSECGFAMTCQLGVCFGCLDDLQCGAGGQCVAGTCIVADLGPAGECLGLACPNGQRCNPTSGICEITCAADADCPQDRMCAPVLNQCIDDFRCDDGADCLTNTCLLNICVGCENDDGCHAGTSCVTVGNLGLGGACLPSFDGSGGPCATAECAEDELCDAQDGSCYPSNGTCGGDDDCRPGYDCNFLGLCSGCSVDGDCRVNQRCLLGACVQLP